MSHTSTRGLKADLCSILLSKPPSPSYVFSSPEWSPAFHTTPTTPSQGASSSLPPLSRFLFPFLLELEYLCPPLPLSSLTPFLSLPPSLPPLLSLLPLSFPLLPSPPSSPLHLLLPLPLFSAVTLLAPQPAPLSIVC